ncbi:MAG TPA: hypothetical protein VLM89_06035 [Phycisphaerae bacterium]|nr:hypothetical protein [Phycisphaerae bacterium]
MSEQTATPALTIEYRPIDKNGTLHITAIVNGQVVHVDRVDVVQASARRRFSKALAVKVPNLDAAEIDAELLRICTEADGRKPTSDAESEILFARPELGHRPELSWCAIPAVCMSESGPVGRWWLYVRWADGRRERLALEQAVNLPNDRRLWLRPQPAPPVLDQPPGWTLDERASWLTGEPVPGPEELFAAICKRIAYYLDFPPKTADGTTATLALWSMLSYVYPAWPAVPYLSVGGPLASGKSRLFEVLAQMVFRPMSSGNLTAPTLFRSLDETGGVLLLDEAERLRDGTPDAGELRSILLSGYKHGTPAKRLEPVGDGKFQTRTFNVYGPKAIAGIGGLPEALASRCIRVPMFRSPPNSPKPRRRIGEDPDTWAKIRDDLHALALEHGPTWLDLARRDDVCPMMSGRDFELWQPLLALAAWLDESGAEGLLSFMQRYAEQVIESGRDDTIPDCDEILLRLLADSVTAGLNLNIGPGELLKQAQEREPNVFQKWTARGVGAALKRYGIQATRSHGIRTYWDVEIRQLVLVERSYGLDLGLGDEAGKLAGYAL